MKTLTRLLILACLLLLPAQGWAAPAHVQSAIHDNTFDTICVVSLTGTTAGNLLVVSLAGNQSSDTLSSVTGANTFSLATKTTNYAGVSLYIYYAANIAGGNETVTATFSSSTSDSCAVHEYSGVATSTPLDVTNSAGSAGSTSTDADRTPSVTTTQDGDLIFASVIDVNALITWTAGTNYTNRQSGLAAGAYHHFTEDRVQATQGAVQGLFTANNADSFIGGIATFKAAGGGGGGGGGAAPSLMMMGVGQ